MSEGNAFLELAKQIPSLGVLSWLVVYFLRNLQAMEKAHSQRMERLIDDYKGATEKNEKLYEKLLERMSHR